MTTSSFALFRLVVLGAVALGLGGCASPAWQTLRRPFAGFGHAPAAAATPAPKKLVSLLPKRVWEDGKSTGAPSITIHLEAQRAYFYKGEHLVGETDISSGRAGYDTPPGDYRVIQKDKDHRSTLYGDFVDESGAVVKTNVDTSKQTAPSGTTFLGAKMPYFLRFQNGYGLHAGKLPGHRASHGCVRLPLSMAEHFFQNVEVGTPVTVRP